MESAPVARSLPAHPTSAAFAALALIATTALLSPTPALAHVQSGVNCQSCHSATRDGMDLTGFFSITNSASSVLKIFQVRPGETANIGVNVTNGRNEYGLALSGLDAGGLGDTSHRLVYQADASWTKRSSYYSVGPRSSNQAWTFRLNVQPGTPPDLYLLKMAMAGVGGGRWGQSESFYLQVVTPVPPAPQITKPTHNGTQFSCEVATVSGYTYFLESLPQIGANTWTVVAQIAGDGTPRILTDANATPTHRLYRIRVE